MLQIHEKIKRARVSAGLTEEEMATKLKVRRSTYQYWETKTPKIDKIMKISQVLGLPDDYFFVSNDEGSVPAKSKEGNTSSDEEKKEETVSANDLIIQLLKQQNSSMKTMEQLMKTQNSLLEDQKKSVVSKISTMEINLNKALGGVSKLSLHVESAREVVLQSLARLEKKKDENYLLREADKKVVEKIESLSEQDTFSEGGN